MPKYFLILAGVLLSFVQYAQAQLNKLEPGFEAGPTAAYVTGFIHGSETAAYINFSATVTGQYKFSDRFSIKTGIGYEGKGYAISTPLITSANINPKTGFTGTSGVINIYYSTGYLVIPVLAKATFGSNKVKFFANAGPYFGLLLGAKVIDELQYTGSKTETSSSNDRNDYQPFDMGLSAGIGIEKQVNGKLSLEIEVRYNQGLLNIAKGSGISNAGFQNETVNLLLGIRYKLYE